MDDTISNSTIPVYLDDELKKHFCQIPNLLYEIQGLKSHERDVYCFLTRIGNQGNACWMSYENMAKKLGMSKRKLDDVKKILAAPFPELDNQPLIFITPRKIPGTNKDTTDSISINGYIWKVSFKKSLGVQEMQGGGAGDAPKEYYSKNTKKDLSKERSKVVAKAPPPLFSFGEFQRIKLSQKDYDDLEKRWGKKKLSDLITAVDGNYEERGITRKNYKAALLNWERREKTYNPQTKKEDIQEKNKVYAEKVVKTLRENGVPKEVRFYLASSYLEIRSTKNNHTKILQFSEKGFKEQLESELRKMNLIKYLT